MLSAQWKWEQIESLSSPRSITISVAILYNSPQTPAHSWLCQATHERYLSDMMISHEICDETSLLLAPIQGTSDFAFTDCPTRNKSLKLHFENIKDL